MKKNFLYKAPIALMAALSIGASALPSAFADDKSSADQNTQSLTDTSNSQSSTSSNDQAAKDKAAKDKAAADADAKAKQDQANADAQKAAEVNTANPATNQPATPAAQPASNDSQGLPQTGSNDAIVVGSVITMAALALVAVLGLKYRKDHIK